MSDDQPLSSAEVCNLSGLTYRMLDNWARMGLIHPVTTGVSNGKGISAADEQRAALSAKGGADIGALAQEYGVSTKTMVRIVARPRSDDASPHAPGSGRSRRWSRDEALVIERAFRLSLIGIAPRKAVEIARRPGEAVEAAPGVHLIVADLSAAQPRSDTA